ncbi:hypothetical protein C4579_02510 [Candidatus Microgenomates bacterium]|nr:MAG: hypothetical protein C4579_02510 [Candidatus Microgenomates bacterium]
MATVEIVRASNTVAPSIKQDIIETTALIISQTPYRQSDPDNYVAAEWYHRTKAALATADESTTNNELEYLRDIEATAESLALSTPSLPEVIHFLAARSIVDYQRSQIGFMPRAATSLEVTP